jgi:hypothetical protein
MVVVSLLVVVTGLLYGYYNQGYKFFNKAFSFGLLQRNARTSLEDLAERIKHASRDYIYADDGYNPGVPFPEDAMLDKPYLYFAIPNISFDVEIKPPKPVEKPAAAQSGPWRMLEVIPINPFKKQKSNLELKADQGVLNPGQEYSTIKSYDYYLYYFAAPKSDPQSEDGPVLTKSARLRVLRYKDQSTTYTEDGGREWPFLPPELVEEESPDDKKISKRGYVGHVKRTDVTDEFSVYKSMVIFDYSGSSYDKLFVIKVNLYDERSDTRVSFETAVAPRN